jgi:hypothetical protein
MCFHVYKSLLTKGSLESKVAREKVDIVPKMFKTCWMMFGCLVVLYFHGFELRHHIYILDRSRSRFQFQTMFLQLNGTDIRGALLREVDATRCAPLCVL